MSVHPLSNAQSRLWILDRFQPGNPTYNIPSILELPGPVDVQALERALDEVVRRHESLRTTFAMIDGKPSQIVAPTLRCGLERAAARPEEVRRLFYEESRRPFDLQRGPLFRALLVEPQNTLILNLHHIVSDGWSMSVLSNELSAIYAAYAAGRESPLPELPLQYADYARWQSKQQFGTQLAYWRKQLEGLRPVLDLPTDRPRPPVTSNRGEVRGFTLDRALVEELKALGRRHGATLFMTLLAAFKVLLHRMSGETDIAVGTPIANRARPELEKLIGFFVNTLVLRTDLSGDPRFAELLAREREVALAAYAHQDLPFEKLVEELQPERDLSRNPLFQILFAVQNIGAVEKNAPVLDARAPSAALGNGTAKFDLTMSLLDTGGGAQGFLEINTDLFDTSTADLMIKYWIALLGSAVRGPELPISRLSMGRVFSASIEGKRIADRLIETVGGVLAARAKVSAAAIAIEDGEERIDYAELNRRVNRVANGLISQPKIAVSMPRGIDAIVSVLGILKAGCVYSPDGAPLTLSEGAPDAEPDVGVRPETIACGSLTHRALCRSGFDERIRVGDADRVAHFSDPLSDRGRYELFATFAGGGTVVLIPGGLAPRKLATMFRDLAITVAFISPEMLDRLSSEFPWALRKLRLILEGRVSLRGDANTGGYFLVDGAPVPNTTIHLLDAHLEPVPRGVRGDVWIESDLVPGMIKTGDVARRRADGTLELRVPAKIPKSAAQEKYVAPRTEMETALAQIWMEALGVERAGVHDNFFRLGGHSLLATQVVARASDTFGIDLPLQKLFEAPTIEQLAKLIVPLAKEAAQPIPRAPRDRPLPLSFAQQRLWFLDRYEPNSTFYNVEMPFDWPGPVDEAALEGAINDLIARHEPLRTTFVLEGGEPVQHIAPELHVALTPAAPARPFDLEKGPLLRAELLRLPGGRSRLLITIHHIAADGWSADIFFRELLTYYEARRTGRAAELPELRVQYADFAQWQRRKLSGAFLAREVEYWRAQLDGAPPLLELPADRPRPRVQTFNGAMCSFGLRGSVNELARREETTPFTILLAAFYVVLHRWTGREDLLVGSPIANRTRPELEPLIGFFANTLVLRARVELSLSFRELIKRVRAVALEAFAHQDVPFEKLVEELQPERSLAYNPIFQVMFASRRTTASPSSAGTGVAKFDLTMLVNEEQHAAIEYNSDLFDRETIARFAEHYEQLLAAAIAEPERPLWSLSMSSPAERLKLAEWNETAKPLDRTPVHRVFEAIAARMPDAPAIWWEGETTSYRELNDRANAAARTFAANTAIAISLPRGVDRIVRVLAVLKAGATCVPIDPQYPEQRRRLIANDAAAQRTDSQLAYVLYTSGSTGTPKGVAMPHAPLANLVSWQIERSRLPPGARTLQLASLSFDVSFQEIFATLCAGGTLVLAGEDERRDPRALWRLIERARVNRIFLPYVALQQLALADDGGLCALVEVITAGEQLHMTPPITAMIRRLGASLYNQYGPTETHVVTEYAVRDPTPAPPIGRPIPNAKIYIFDAFGQPCAIGTPGELYIGGDVLARGYLGRPELTAERFLPDPEGGRLYRTGDRARFLRDGSIQFLGRLDDQLKIRGFRIEPAEIETALRTHPAVREAIVAAREGELAAWVRADLDHAPSPRELRAHLLERLPDHMVPSIFSITGELPQTPSGKLDRRALDVAPRAASSGGVAPRTPLESDIAAIWCTVLAREAIGIDDSFFELGGHSLLATRVIARIRDELGVEVPVRRIFETPAVEGLALAVLELALSSLDEREAEKMLAEVEGCASDSRPTDRDR